MLRLKEQLDTLPTRNAVTIAPHGDVYRGYLKYFFSSNVETRFFGLPTNCPIGEAEGMFYPLLRLMSQIYAEQPRKDVKSPLYAAPVSEHLYSLARESTMLLSTVAGLDGKSVNQALVAQKALILKSVLAIKDKPLAPGGQVVPMSTLDIIGSLLTGAITWDRLMAAPTAQPQLSGTLAQSAADFAPWLDVINLNGLGITGSERLSAKTVQSLDVYGQILASFEGDLVRDSDAYALSFLLSEYLFISDPEHYASFFPTKQFQVPAATSANFGSSLTMYIAVCYLASQARLLASLTFGSVYATNLLKLVEDWLPANDRRLGHMKTYIATIKAVIEQDVFRMCVEPVLDYIGKVEQTAGCPLVAAYFFDGVFSPQDWAAIYADEKANFHIKNQGLKGAPPSEEVRAFYAATTSAQGPLDAVTVGNQRLRPMTADGLDRLLSTTELSLQKIAETASVLMARTRLFEPSLRTAGFPSRGYPLYFSGTHALATVNDRPIAHEDQLAILDTPNYLLDLTTGTYRSPVLVNGIRAFSLADWQLQGYVKRALEKQPYLLLRRDPFVRTEGAMNASLSVAPLPLNYFRDHTRNLTLNHPEALLSLLSKMRFHNVSMRGGFRQMLDVQLTVCASDLYKLRMLATQLMSYGWLYYHGAKPDKQVTLMKNADVDAGQAGVVLPFPSFYYGAPIDLDAAPRILGGAAKPYGGQAYRAVDAAAFADVEDPSNAVLAINAHFSVVIHQMTPRVTRYMLVATHLSDLTELVTILSTDGYTSKAGVQYERIEGWTDFATTLPYLYALPETFNDVIQWTGTRVSAWGDILDLQRPLSACVWELSDLTDMAGTLENLVLSEVRPHSPKSALTLADFAARTAAINVHDLDAGARGPNDTPVPASSVAPSAPGIKPGGAKPGGSSAAAEALTAKVEERRATDAGARITPTGLPGTGDVISATAEEKAAEAALPSGGSDSTPGGSPAA